MSSPCLDLWLDSIPDRHNRLAVATVSFLHRTAQLERTVFINIDAAVRRYGAGLIRRPPNFKSTVAGPEAQSESKMNNIDVESVVAVISMMASINPAWIDDGNCNRHRSPSTLHDHRLNPNYEGD